MGKGSSKPQQVVQSGQTETYQSRLPKYAEPYFHNLKGRAQALSYEDYIPYEGPRVAGFSPEQLGAQQGIKSIAQRDMPLMRQAGQIASRSAQGSPLMASSTYNAAPIYTGVRGFGPEAYLAAGQQGFDANRYMSPYLEHVMDRQQRRAVQRFYEGRAGRNAQAIKSGAFGGSRQAVGDFLARREMSERLGDIEAQQLEKGYQSGRSQFEADRAARFKALGMSDAQALSLAKQQSQEQIATEEAKRQAASQNLQAQITNQKAMETAMGRGLKGAGVLADLTKQEQALDLQRLKSLSDVGTQRQGMLQQAYDTAYEDFLKQREYPYEQLERFSGMLQGLPVTPSYTKSFYSPRANPTAQLLQTGLGAYGMGRGMGMFGSG